MTDAHALADPADRDRPGAERPHAVVVGAGLGGLATAVALHAAGWSVEVLEQAPHVSAIGAGIAMAPNALRALDVLGVGDDVRARAAVQGAGGYRTPGGRWLIRTDLSAVAQRLGDTFVVLRRRDLVDLLLARLPEGTVRFGAVVTDVDPGGDDRPAVVLTEDDGHLEADLVVGADGVSSRLRATLFPGHPGLRYAGYTAWRLLPQDAPQDVAATPFETWGRGLRFSALPMDGGAVYCWATATAPPRERADDERADLLSRFGDWHQPVPDLIRATPATSVLRHDVVELARPLRRLGRGRAVLVGDAAHAMTPDLGQGGCTALEDAVVLAHALATEADVPTAITAYGAARLPRTTAIARRSRQLSRIGQAHNPLVVAARTVALGAAGLLPAGVLLGSMAPVVGWRPPSDRRKPSA